MVVLLTILKLLQHVAAQFMHLNQRVVVILLVGCILEELSEQTLWMLFHWLVEHLFIALADIEYDGSYDWITMGYVCHL